MIDFNATSIAIGLASLLQRIFNNIASAERPLAPTTAHQFPRPNVYVRGRHLIQLPSLLPQDVVSHPMLWDTVCQWD